MGIPSFDVYTWKARILPMVTVFFPLTTTIALLGLFPHPSNITLWSQLGELALRFIAIPFVLLGIGMLFSQIGRDKGSLKQKELWERWGGAPTTQILRHRTIGNNKYELKRRHQKIRSKFPEIRIPFENDEQNDPDEADMAYQAAINAIIGLTRDKEKFHLVFEENVSYGYRRNLWGLKRWGVVSSIIGLVIAIVVGVVTWKNMSLFHLLFVLSIAINSGFLVMWFQVITPEWVRIPADAYARRLMEAFDQI